MKRLVAICLTGLLLLTIFPAASAQETYDWKMARPSSFVTIDEKTESSYSDGIATVGLGVNVKTYYENDGMFDYNDALGLRIAATANTREIITYDVTTTSYTWYDVTDPTGIIGDDQGAYISFTYPVRFYGGRRSAEYYGANVSSNGFITFDSNPTDRYYGRTIPSEDGPNTFIAPFWTDLKPNEGGSITWGYVSAVPGSGIPGYVISWNNVPNKYGTPQTFQAVIEQAPGSPDIYRNIGIWFNYQSITLDDDTTVGIEDQRGLRGVSYNYQNLGNGMALRFRQTSNHAFIQYLTIKLNREGDEYAIIDIDPGEEGDWLRGENIELTSSEPDPLLRWAFPLAGAGALCLEHLSPLGWVKTAGIVLGTILVGIDVVEALAYSLSPAEYVEVVDDIPTPQPESHIKVAAIDLSSQYTCVDAALGVRVWWIFSDPNDRDHDLTITAELTYAVFDNTGALVAYETIPTSVDLRVYTNWRQLSISTAGHGTTAPAPGTHTYEYGTSENVTAYPNPAYVFNYWLLDGIRVTGNPITVTMDSNHTLRAYFRSKDGGGGGGCPYISTWNGTSYVLDNNLIPAAEYSNGSDVIDHYKLQQPLTFVNGSHSLRISDLDKHSFIDQIQLIAVEHESNITVAVSPSGAILTFKDPAPPTTVFNRNGSDISDLLKTPDGQYYEGYAGDYLILDFENIDVQHGAKLVIRSDLPPEETPKSPVYIQTMNSTETWQTVTTIYPRFYWATDIVDMFDYLPDINGELKIRICFTSEDRIDYIGLDTTEQGEFEVHHANLAKATHSTHGNVKEALRNSDNQYAELLPSEQITLKFTVPQNTKENRDFVITIEGHYHLIPP